MLRGVADRRKEIESGFHLLNLIDQINYLILCFYSTAPWGSMVSYPYYPAAD